MNELLSVSPVLTALAVRFFACIAKKTGEAFRDLFSKDEAKSILNQAFAEFKEKAIHENKSTPDEKVLLEVFEQFFSDDRTIKEFQCVFDAQSQEADFNLLDEVFVRICIDKNIEISQFNFFQAMDGVIKEIERLAQNEEKLQGIFQTNRLANIYATLQKRGTENNRTFARFKYLDQLKRHHNRLLFAGIPDLKEKKDVELPAIFVMPRAGESVTTEDYRAVMRERQEDNEFTGEEIQLRRMMITRKEEVKAPVKFAQVFEESTNRCFVVLGKPGSGKSTLLKYLVLKAARMHLDFHRDSRHFLFPVLVEIRKLENALSKTNRTDYNILDFLYDSVRTYYNLTLPPGFFEEYLGIGRALLLFDGLDEVAAEARRAEIQQMISAFVTGYPMGNTVIVTSRIAGYNRAQFSTADYRHFTLEDFDDEEINMFIERWYRSRLANEKEADDKAADLKNALEKKPRIKELARNPLLLTIIGIIHRYEAQLPEDRLLLYDKAAEALLYTWDNVKEIIDERFKLVHRRRFLGQVAFHLQSLEKGDEAGTMIHRNDLYKILLADFCKAFNCDEWGAQALVNEFIETIRSRAGLLVELGPDRFGFAHKTFQEYFAARWLANETTLKFNLQIMIDYVDKFIDNAFWHETLILALQALPEEQALNVLKYILGRDPWKIEPYFYHNHYFVMKFIAEKGEWLNDQEFVETQINDFFRFSWNEDKNNGFFKNMTWNRFRNWLSSVSDSLVGSIFSKKLLLLVEDARQIGALRRSCAEAVGKLGFKDNAVAECLLHLAEDEKQDIYLRCSCVEAVGKLGLKDKAISERLLRLAEDKKQGGDLRRSCAETIGHLGFTDKGREILLHLAEDEKQDIYLRRSCACAVGNLGFKDKAVEILLHLAENKKQYGFFLYDCSEALVYLGFKDKAVEILLHLVENEKQDGDLRRASVVALEHLGFKEKTLAERLLPLAEDMRQKGSLRRYCALAVGHLGLKKKAGEILLHLAEDEKQDGSFRSSCAYAVGQLGFKDKAAVGRLLKLAEDKRLKGPLRSSCAYTVGQLGFKDNAVVKRLLQLAEDEKQYGDLRCSCAEAIGHLGFKDKAVKILLHLSEDKKQDGKLRRSCASALGNLGEKDKAVAILTDLFLSKVDKYSSNLKRIYNSLWELTAV